MTTSNHRMIAEKIALSLGFGRSMPQWDICINGVVAALDATLPPVDADAELLSDFTRHLMQRHEDVCKERDCYRAVLVAAEYERVDDLPSRGIAFCQAVGARAAERTKEIAAATLPPVDPERTSRLGEIRKRLEAATPGPWIHIDDEPIHPDYDVFSATKTMLSGNPCPIAIFEWDEDEAFCVNALADIAYLLAIAAEIAPREGLRGALEAAVEPYKNLPEEVLAEVAPDWLPAALEALAATPPASDEPPEFGDNFDYLNWLTEMPDWLDAKYIREPDGGLVFSKKVADQTVEIMRAAAAYFATRPDYARGYEQALSDAAKVAHDHGVVWDTSQRDYRWMEAARQIEDAIRALLPPKSEATDDL